MKKLLEKLRPLVFFLLLLYLLILGVGMVFLYLRLEDIAKTADKIDPSTNQQEAVVAENLNPLVESTGCNQTCKEEIAKEVSKVAAKLSEDTKTTVVEKTTVVTQVAGGTDFIPMGTSHSTTETDWVDVPDSTIYFDLINDYGESAAVSWEASLRVAHANGKAFARLYDGTHNIAVDLSEISTENNSEFMRVTTGSLPFWRGHNLYKVQIKSLNSFEVTYSGGKIKVSY